MSRTMSMKRYALVSLRGTTAEAICRYLPSNYDKIGSAPRDDTVEGTDHLGPYVVIAGRDNAGWTLDGYVLPRLASGLIFGKEIGLDHPVMKTIEEER